MMGSAIGLINTGGTLGGFVSPIVIGYLVEKTHGYASAFLFLFTGDGLPAGGAAAHET